MENLCAESSFYYSIFIQLIITKAGKQILYNRSNLFLMKTMTNSKLKNQSIKSLPDKGTRSAKEYFQGTSQNLGLFNFVTHTIITADYIQSTAKRTLDEMEAIDTGIKISDPPPEWGEFGSHLLELKKYYQVLLQAFFVRCMDNFEIYLVDILQEVLKKNRRYLLIVKKIFHLNIPFNIPLSKICLKML